MDTARYVLALISIMSYPSAIGLWYVMHPFIGFWRKLGRPLSYTLLFGAAFIAMGVVYLWREPILAVDYGTNRALWPLVILFYGASLFVELRCRKHLKTKILIGVPELEPGGHGGQLITEGIYGTIRHPRYVAVWLGTAAFAFFTNYLIMYVLVVLLIPALYAVVILEEKELLDRFGEEYVWYRERVPRRFIPRRA